MDAIEALRSRRSIGKLEGDVDDATVRELIELAVLAPNHRLTEPWRFTVVRGAARERLGSVWAPLGVAKLPLQGAERAAALEREAAKLKRAPVLIVVSVRTDADAVTATEDLCAAAAATQNLLIAANAKGLGAMWRTGDMAESLEVKQFLGLDPSDRIVAFVYLGAPAMEAPQPKPRSVDAVTRILE